MNWYTKDTVTCFIKGADYIDRTVVINTPEAVSDLEYIIYSDYDKKILETSLLQIGSNFIIKGDNLELLEEGDYQGFLWGNINGNRTPLMREYIRIYREGCSEENENQNEISFTVTVENIEIPIEINSSVVNYYLDYDSLTPEQKAELQQPAIDAAVIANTAANNANIAAANANNATTNANNAANLANQKANEANTATANANTATVNANNATDLAIQKSAEANTAANNADNSAQLADNAASSALQAANEANTTNTAVELAENERVLAENERVAQENDRQTWENERDSNEDARILQESWRESAETTRQNNETSRQTAESNRTTSESSRVTAEDTRQGNETTRQNQEATRQNNETTRITAENNRVSAETGRVTAESTRENNETSRQTAENNRATAESSRVNAENARVTAETNRGTAESGRVTAENSRVSSETARQNQETTRQTNETARVTAESNRVSAETGRVTAEATRQWRIKEITDFPLTGYYNATTGVYTANSSYASTNRLKAVAGQKFKNPYLGTASIPQVVFFKADGSFLASQYNQTEITAPANTAFVAFTRTSGGTAPINVQSDFWASQQSDLLFEYIHSVNKEVVIQSIDYATNTFTAPNHGLVNATLTTDKVGISFNKNENIIPSLLLLPMTSLPGSGFHVVNATTNTFQLSIAVGGSPITLTEKGTVDFSKWKLEANSAVSTNTANTLTFTNLPKEGVSVYMDANIMGYYGFYMNMLPTQTSDFLRVDGGTWVDTMIQVSNLVRRSSGGMIHFRQVNNENGVRLFYDVMQIEVSDNTLAKIYEARFSFVSRKKIDSSTLQVKNVMIANGTTIKIYKL